MMDLKNVVVFHGDLSPQLARLYVRCPDLDSRKGLTLQGSVYGPTNDYTRTLPAQMLLEEIASNSDLLAHALIPDPCFWSPGAPYLYQVDVELRQAGNIISTAQSRLGLRRFGVSGSELILEAKPWDLTAVTVDSLPEASIDACRGHDAVAYVRNPSDAFCDRASQQGVMIMAEVDGSSTALLRPELARLGRHAAVTIVVARGCHGVSQDLRCVAPNLLLAQQVGPLKPLQSSEWADLVVCELTDENGMHTSVRSCPCPLLVRGRSSKPISLTDAIQVGRDLKKRLDIDRPMAGIII